MKTLKTHTLLPALFIFISIALSAKGQNTEQTVGLFQNDEGSFNGYTLFAPLLYTKTYLIDNDGLLINSWASDFPPGNSVYLLENGHLLRAADQGGNITFVAGGDAGRVEEFDWEGNLVWEFEYSSRQYRQHHDIEPLPNGNILLLAWELKTREECIAAGRDSSILSENELWPEHLVEVEPNGASGGSIVWEWHVWDHLIQDHDSTKANYGVVEDHPELIDVNYYFDFTGADWLHANGIDYNEELDQIIISIRRWNEFWVIDHSTTTEEAASHEGGNSGKGGDLLYRWGNPASYRAGTADDQKLFKQHDAQWIEPGLPGAGNILVFNNGQGRPGGDASSVDEIIPPVDSLGNYALTPGSAFGPEELTWSYLAENPTDFYSQIISGAQRLPNGNTLICSGVEGKYFEVNPAGEIVWLYLNPVTNNGPLTQGDPIPTFRNGTRYTNMTFRANRYAPDYPAFTGKDLTPGDPIELERMTGVDEIASELPTRFELHQNYPNPFSAPQGRGKSRLSANPTTTIHYQLAKSSPVELKIFDMQGREIRALVNATKEAGHHSIQWNGKDNRGKPVGTGVYLYRLKAGDLIQTRKLLLVK